MTPEKLTSQNQEVNPVTPDPTLNKQAVDEVMERYGESASADGTTELNPSTEKELGEVERALDNLTMGIEDAS